MSVTGVTPIVRLLSNYLEKHYSATLDELLAVTENRYLVLSALKTLEKQGRIRRGSGRIYWVELIRLGTPCPKCGEDEILLEPSHLYPNKIRCTCMGCRASRGYQ